MCNFLHFTMVVMCLIIENYIICVIHNLRQQLQKHQASKRKSKQSNFIYLSMVCFVLFVAAVAKLEHPFVRVCICMCVSVRLITPEYYVASERILLCMSACMQYA